MKLVGAASFAFLAVTACGGDSLDKSGPSIGNAGAGDAASVRGNTAGVDSTGDTGGSGTGGTGMGGTTLGTAGQGVAGTAGAGGGPGRSTVHFHYTPEWQGVTDVSVIGAFGRNDDWSKPLLKLTTDANGTFSGSVALPAGKYAYLFAILGDVAAKVPATRKRLALDPTLPAFTVCPAASPSASATAANPCSLLTVPEAAPAALFHVSGKAQIDGAPAKNWMAVIERDEMGSHHFLVNRQDTTGAGAYDFSVAAGTYRIQLLPPDAEKQTDAQQTPLTSPYARRCLSTAFKVNPDVTLDAAELALHDYAKMTPTDGNAQALPLTLTFTLPQGATAVRASVYGPGDNIGDPWWDTPYSTKTTALFDGNFTTTHATAPAALPGKTYHWGIWAQNAPGTGGVAWTRQSLVLPLAVQ